MLSLEHTSTVPRCSSLRTNAVHCDSLPLVTAKDAKPAALSICKFFFLQLTAICVLPSWDSLWFSCWKLSSISCSALSSVSASEINRQHNSGLINFLKIIWIGWLTLWLHLRVQLLWAHVRFVLPVSQSVPLYNWPGSSCKRCKNENNKKY